MEIIPLSVPYLVLSTQQHMDGLRQVHARTPFGAIDISVKVVEGVQFPPLFDVTAEGDLNSWILDHKMPDAFRTALFELVGKIAVAHSGWSVYSKCRLIVSFKGDTEVFTLSGQLEPGQFNLKTTSPSFRDGSYLHCAQQKEAQSSRVRE